MRANRFTTLAMLGSLAVAPVMVGCESLPGDEKTQGAVIGGVGGAAAGAMLGGDNKLVGGLIGGALGAGGGYLIGQQLEKNDRGEAEQASQRAQAEPATAADVRNARSADVNDDGFVTLDEVAAMEEAGLTDRQMVDRLESTGQIFALNSTQEDYLRDRGVSEGVIDDMRDLNRESARQASDRNNRARTYDDDVRSERISERY